MNIPCKPVDGRPGMPLDPRRARTHLTLTFCVFMQRECDSEKVDFFYDINNGSVSIFRSDKKACGRPRPTGDHLRLLDAVWTRGC